MELCKLGTYLNREDPDEMLLSAAFHQCLHCLLGQNLSSEKEIHLSYDVASGSEITPCNKICKPLVVYRFSGNVMTSITTLRI